jgi:hypothetical protein
MILYEANQGSDTNGVVLNAALREYNETHSTNHALTIKKVPASLSKFDRALPLQQAIQQHRWHPVGSFPELESQLTTWTPEAVADDETDDKKNKRDKSPDHMDSAVHGFRELMGIGGKGQTMGRQIASARLDSVTAVADLFCDLYGLVLSNSGAAATKVSIRDATGGTIRMVFYVPAGDTRGFMLPDEAAVPQTAVNNNWTALCGTATTALDVTALYVKVT